MIDLGTEIYAVVCSIFIIYSIYQFIHALGEEIKKRNGKSYEIHPWSDLLIGLSCFVLFHVILIISTTIYYVLKEIIK